MSSRTVFATFSRRSFRKVYKKCTSSKPSTLFRLQLWADVVPKKIKYGFEIPLFSNNITSTGAINELFFKYLQTFQRDNLWRAQSAIALVWNIGVTPVFSVDTRSGGLQCCLQASPYTFCRLMRAIRNPITYRGWVTINSRHVASNAPGTPKFLYRVEKLTPGFRWRNPHRFLANP